MYPLNILHVLVYINDQNEVASICEDAKQGEEAELEGKGVEDKNPEVRERNRNITDIL